MTVLISLLGAFCFLVLLKNHIQLYRYKKKIERGVHRKQKICQMAGLFERFIYDRGQKQVVKWTDQQFFDYLKAECKDSVSDLDREHLQVLLERAAYAQGEILPEEEEFCKQCFREMQNSCWKKTSFWRRIYLWVVKGWNPKNK